MVLGRDSGIVASTPWISVELWTPETSCTLPPIPLDPDAFEAPTVNLLNGLPVACANTYCYQLNEAGWVHYQDVPRMGSFSHHTSVDLEDGLYLVHGHGTDVLPVDGGEPREGFPLDRSRTAHCSIQVSHPGES